MLQERVKSIQVKLRSGTFASESAVSQGVVLPVLHELGWPVFDPQAVIPEYTVEGRRVDFALCDQHQRPRIFLEVKKVGQSDGGDRQLFEYAFHQGIPFAILTDGQEWSFYLPGEEGLYEERRVYKLDLLLRTADECTERLNRYLSYERVLSGQALQEARAEYRDVAKARQIETTFPRAWTDLLASQDSLLMELLAVKVEDLCGYRPDIESCSRFFAGLASPPTARPRVPSSPSVPEVNTQQDLPASTSNTSTSDKRSGFAFEGKFHPAGSAREVMQEVLTLFSQRDSTFLERFASRKHGRKRRYLSRDRYELYPGRPDLCEVHAVEFVPGWWLGTNYSKQNITDIIKLACEVAQVRFDKDVVINLV